MGNRFSRWQRRNSRRVSSSLPGVEDTVRGFSAVSLMLIDEAAPVNDDLYKTVRPMLAVGDGDLWLMSTPNGQRGFFYNEWMDGGDRWKG
jgi:hypothetical protein